MNYTLVLRPSQVADYRANPQFRHNPHCKIAVLDEELNIAETREAIRAEVGYGEWACQIDDNVTDFTCCNQEFYQANDDIGIYLTNNVDTSHPPRAEYDPILNEPVTFLEFWKRAVEDAVRVAEERSAHIITFSAHENPFFRRTKFLDCGYTLNKFVLLKKSKLHWDQSNGFPAMEECALCAAEHLEHGRVLVSRWAHVVAGHYQPGGLGTYAERVPGKIAACSDIMLRFPGFWQYNKGLTGTGTKKGCAANAELVTYMRTLKQVEKWRQSMAGRNPNVKDL